MRAERHDRLALFPGSFGGEGASPLQPRVRIVGGGLTGILAAFQAHAMGAREIELYERLDRLGGIALPELHQGCEMREGCIYFGPPSDPIRQLLEAHGAQFTEFDNRFGSVAAGHDGLTVLDDFGGPALAGADINLSPLAGESLGDRLACYADELAAPLARYVTWHTGCAPDELHASAAIPMAINRIYPAGADLDALAVAKRADPLADELFGIPRSLWGYTSNTRASLPVGGFAALFRHCRAALDAIGVRIHERQLATPRAMLGAETAGDIVVWAASPIPLFKAVGLEVPRAPARKFATYTYAARWTGPLPFYVQNFTAEGQCFRVYVYDSNGRTLVTAECVERADESALPREIQRLLAGFAGTLTLGDLLFRSIKPRWLYHSVETIDRLRQLRGALRALKGESFVTGAWEAYAKGAKFVEVDTDLQRALTSDVTLEAL
jgi:hypothetical protein